MPAPDAPLIDAARLRVEAAIQDAAQEESSQQIPSRRPRITRLTALWQSWEAMRLQPGTGIANWLRDHLDHQLPILLGRGGPFAQYSEDEHIDPRIATTDPPSPGW